MKLSFTTLLLLSAAAIAAQAQAPAIKAGGVVNSASYAASGLPNGPIAQGSLFNVFGSNLGPAAIQSASSYPLSATLAGTSMTVTVNGSTTKPLMVYTLASQLAAILPSTTPAGTGTITVTYNGQTSATVPVTVIPSSFGIYAANQQGNGLGIITNQNFQLAGPTAAANAGEAYIIFGTGVGPVTGDETGPGSGLKLGTIPVEVLVGGKSATVYGYARAPQFSGEDQIAFAVPAGVTGCSVPVAVKIGNVISNYVTMPIAASGRTCSDPAGLGGPVTVTSNGVISIGGINLSHTVTSISSMGISLDSNLDSGSASFTRYSYTDYSSFANPFQISSYGACTVYVFQGSTVGGVAAPNPTNLDAGSALTINGPNGAKTLTRLSGSYSATLGGGTTGIPGLPAPAPLYLTKGTYSVTGPGGADVGAFTAMLSVPDPLVWTNSASVTSVVRANGQLITWTGGDPTGQTYIFGYSTAGTGNSSVGAEFVCVQQTSAGQFTVPNTVLLSLPATTGTAIGIISVQNSNSAAFKASGLDVGSISFSSGSSRTVTYQ